MSHFFQFFLCKHVEQKQILNFIEDKLEIKLHCLEYPNENAPGVLSFLEDEGDIRINLELALPDNVNITLTEEEIAVLLSVKFKTDVIYFNPKFDDENGFPSDDEREYNMVDEKGNKYAVNIKDEDTHGDKFELLIIDKIKI